jgi:type II secretory pathway pseudopilin PulG
MTRPDSGSMLVETLIAAAIVAAMTGAMFVSLAGSAERQRMVAQRRQALMVARSELALVGAEVPARPGRVTGLSGPYAWQIDISPYGGDLNPSQAGGLAAVTVTVRRDPHGAPLATLHTLRLMPNVTGHG